MQPRMVLTRGTTQHLPQQQQYVLLQSFHKHCLVPCITEESDRDPVTITIECHYCKTSIYLASAKFSCKQIILRHRRPDTRGAESLASCDYSSVSRYMCSHAYNSIERMTFLTCGMTRRVNSQRSEDLWRQSRRW